MVQHENAVFKCLCFIYNFAIEQNLFQPKLLWVRKTTLTLFVGVNGVEVKLLSSGMVPLVCDRIVGSGTGNATCKATPVAKMRTAIKTVSPRRKSSWVTESRALGWLLVLLLFSASPSYGHASAWLPSSSKWTFSSWVLTRAYPSALGTPTLSESAFRVQRHKS